MGLRRPASPALAGDAVGPRVQSHPATQGSRRSCRPQLFRKASWHGGLSDFAAFFSARMLASNMQFKQFPELRFHQHSRAPHEPNPPMRYPKNEEPRMWPRHCHVWLHRNHSFSAKKPINAGGFSSLTLCMVCIWRLGTVRFASPFPLWRNP